MTRVVPDQKLKFENDEFFRKLSRESEVRYTGYRDRAHEERAVRFQAECREGRCQVAFVASGTNLLLALGPPREKRGELPAKEYLDFDKDPSKVYMKSRLILNGVCVITKMWLDAHRLDGAGYLEFDEETAKIEDKILRETIEQSRLRLQEFEERQRRMKHDVIDGNEVTYQTHGDVIGGRQVKKL